MLKNKAHFGVVQLYYLGSKFQSLLLKLHNESLKLINDHFIFELYKNLKIVDFPCKVNAPLPFIYLVFSDF